MTMFKEPNLRLALTLPTTENKTPLMSNEMEDNAVHTSDIIFYTSPQGAVKVEVIFNDETFWLTKKRMSELFGVDVRTVNEHLQNIYNTDELVKEATIRKIRTVQKEGNQKTLTYVTQKSINQV